MRAPIPSHTWSRVFPFYFFSSPKHHGRTPRRRCFQAHGAMCVRAPVPLLNGSTRRSSLPSTLPSLPLRHSRSANNLHRPWRRHRFCVRLVFILAVQPPAVGRLGQGACLIRWCAWLASPSLHASPAPLLDDAQAEIAKNNARRKEFEAWLKKQPFDVSVWLEVKCTCTRRRIQFSPLLQDETPATA
jgi:hypothetical protein